MAAALPFVQPEGGCTECRALVIDNPFGFGYALPLRGIGNPFGFGEANNQARTCSDLSKPSPLPRRG